MKLGMNATLEYSNNLIGATPSWVAVPQARDVTNSDSMQEADVTTRAAGGFTLTAATLRDLSIETELLWTPGETAFDALYAAYKARTPKGFRILDATSGRGVMFDGQIFEFSRGEPLNGVIMVTLRIRPTYSATAPTDVTP
jgi:hypothetical protein